MLNHTGAQTLETERLILRRFRPEDAEAMYRNWASDGEVCKYMRWKKHVDLQETQKVVAFFVNGYADASFYQWTITLQSKDEPIGAIKLTVINENDECADVAYLLGRTWWHIGIMPEALRAVLGFAFRTVGLNRVEAYHSVNNPGSGRVMQKAGMTKESYSRQKYRSNVGFEDCELYGILREDYFK